LSAQILVIPNRLCDKILIIAHCRLLVWVGIFQSKILNHYQYIYWIFLLYLAKLSLSDSSSCPSFTRWRSGKASLIGTGGQVFLGEVKALLSGVVGVNLVFVFGNSNSIKNRWSRYFTFNFKWFIKENSNPTFSD